MKKQNIMPVLVLTVICIAVAALLGVVNMVTGPIIQKAEEQKVYDSLREVLDGDFAPMEIPEGAPDTVTAIYDVTEKNGDPKGKVVTVEQKGYADKILLTIGIDAEGKTTKVVITYQAESHGQNITPLLDRLSAGISADEVDGVEVVANATYSSGYIKSAVADAFKAYALVSGGSIEDEGNGEEEGGYTPPVSQREDSELITLAGELVEGATGFTEVEFDAEAKDAKYLAKVFKENSGKGYVAYVVVISANYGTVESETLIHIENDGKIKSVNKLACNISPANPEWGYNPPTSEEVDAFYDRLPENSSETIDGVELVTNATNTTTNVKDSIKEALVIVSEIILSDTPTPETEINNLASELVGEEVTLINVTPEESVNVKRLYKVDGNKGYIVYLVVMSTHYAGQVETETLVYVGNDLQIKGIKRLQWNVSAAAPDWGYNPPSEETLVEFYNGLIGKDNETLGDVDLSTGATNTTTALVSAISEGINCVKEFMATELPTQEDELENLASELVGEDVTLTNVTPDGEDHIKRIYKLDGDKGYIVYLVVMSTHYAGQVETETLVYVGNDLQIKGIKKLQWNVSAAAPDWGYNPPSEEALIEFYNGLVGKDNETLGGVDLSTGATNTTTALVNAIIDAINAVEADINSDVLTPEEDVFNFATELVGEGASLVKVDFEGAEFTKIIYKDENGKGFVAYIVVMSTHYEGQVETETLVYVGSDLKIKGIKRLQWNVSEAAPDWGYNPPSEEVLVEFYNGLIGKDSNALGEVNLSTGATNTTTALVNSIIEAVNKIGELTTDGAANVDYTARIVGLVIVALMVICPIGIKVYTCIKRRES